MGGVSLCPWFRIIDDRKHLGVLDIFTGFFADCSDIFITIPMNNEQLNDNHANAVYKCLFGWEYFYGEFVNEISLEFC